MTSDSTVVFDIQWDPPRRWTLTLDQIRLSVTGVTFDRGAVRVSIKVYRVGTLVWPDRVNLSSGQSRSAFLKRLRDATAMEIPEGALIALEEAIQHLPAIPRDPVDEGGDISGTVPATFSELEELVKGYLLLDDPDVLAVMLAVVASHRLGGDPLWLLIVGPPSSAKTDLTKLLSRIPGIYPLSDLTPRTLASGLDTPNGDPSLLARLTDQILVLKDFTTVLSMQRDDRQEILAQLREVYDGRFDKVWGTGKELHWRGRLGLVAGVTPIIDKHHAVMAILGQRFGLLRMRQPDRRQAAKRAIQNRRKDRMALDRLAAGVAGFVAGLAVTTPEITDEQEERITLVADLVTGARSAVERDGYNRELDYAPEPEMPPRLASQFLTLAQGLALIHGRTQIEAADLVRVVRVGLDCIPAVRLLALKALAHGEGDPTTSSLATQVQYSTTTVRRALEDLQALGLVTCQKQSPGLPDQWRLLPPWHVVLLDLLGAGRKSSATDPPSDSPATDPPPAPPATDPPTDPPAGEPEAANSDPPPDPVPPETDEYRREPWPGHGPIGGRWHDCTCSWCVEATRKLQENDSDPLTEPIWTITGATKARLRDLGYAEAEIAPMTPRDAWLSIMAGRRMAGASSS